MVDMTNVAKIVGCHRIAELSLTPLNNRPREFLDELVKEAVTKMYSDGCTIKAISDHIGINESMVEGMI